MNDYDLSIDLSDGMNDVLLGVLNIFSGDVIGGAVFLTNKVALGQFLHQKHITVK